MKKILLLGFSTLLCFAAIKDSDLDGVPDNLDKCPNTPFLETVNLDGCSKSQLKNSIKLYLNIGYEYDHYKTYSDSKIIFTSISAKRKNIKTSLFYSMINQNSKYNSNDLIWSLYYYNYSLKNILLKLGGKVYFPTDNNNKTDYALLLKGSYFFKNYDITLSEKHKIYGESGTNAKDTIFLSIGATYNKFYISPYAYTENSNYNSSKWYQYAGITLNYSINKKVNITLDSSIDLQQSQNYTITTSLGVSF